MAHELTRAKEEVEAERREEEERQRRVDEHARAVEDWEEARLKHEARAPAKDELEREVEAEAAEKLEERRRRVEVLARAVEEVEGRGGGTKVPSRVLLGEMDAVATGDGDSQLGDGLMVGGGVELPQSLEEMSALSRWCEERGRALGREPAERRLCGPCANFFPSLLVLRGAGKCSLSAL